MRRWSSLVVALLLAPSASADEPDVGVSVETSRQLYAPGDDVEIVVTNRRPVPVFVMGCGSYQVQRLEDEKYRSLRPEHCVSEGTAIEIPPGKHSLKYVPGGERSGQVLRVALPFGWGCEKDRELSQARCADFATAYSASFRVGRGGGP
jgi:hypothetical protein